MCKQGPLPATTGILTLLRISKSSKETSNMLLLVFSEFDMRL
jgi:hypothetical protein